MKFYPPFKKEILGISFFAFCKVLGAQEFSCSMPEDRKEEKIALTVIDTNISIAERLSASIELVKMNSNSTWALFKKTELQYWRNWSMQKPVEVLEDEFQEIIEKCPDDFPITYYYLANIAYLKGNPEKARALYQKFIAASRGFDEVPPQRIQEAKESIKVLDFQAEVEASKSAISPYALTGINTADQEYLPAIAPDNSQLFVTRKSKEKNLGDFGYKDVEKIVFSTRLEKTNDFTAAEVMEYPFNHGPGNYGGMSISLTGKEIFLTVCNRDRTGYANCDLFRSTKKVSAIEGEKIYYVWREFDTLSTKINKPDSWESQPSLSSDGKSLLFAKYSDFTNGIDIYIAYRDSSGEWGAAQPLGGKVNTAGNEKAPFLHPDGNTLYFSSDGHMGLGGFDIFMSRKENGEWQSPVNLGLPINSPDDEHGLIVSTDGKYGYFASNTVSQQGDFDIISFEMPENFKPEEVLVYKGFVDNPADGATMELTRADGKKIRDVAVEAGDGMFATILKKDDLSEPVVATVKKKGYAFTSEVISAKNSEDGIIKSSKLTLEEITENQPYRINDINFNSNSYELLDEAKFVLNRFKEFLDLNASYRVEIRGHTDNIGAASDNKQLSVNRALAVKKYLESLGVSSSRLSYKGFGQEMPVEDNSTEAGRAKNRRTEFVLKKGV